MELMVALALFFILASGVFYVITSSYNNFYGEGDKQTVANFAKEGLEAVKSIAANNWVDLDNAVGANRGVVLNSSTKKWEFSGSSNTKGNLTRVINVIDVVRDDTFNIKESGGTDDPFTKRVTVSVTGGGISEYRLAEYVTEWRFSSWEQNDWTGGPGYSFFGATNVFDTESFMDYSNVEKLQIYSDGGVFEKNGSLDSGALNLFSTNKTLYKIEVFQEVPNDCVNEIVLLASNASDFSGTPVTQTFNSNEGYYRENINANMSGYDWIKYQVNMTNCTDNAESPILNALKIYYR